MNVCLLTCPVLAGKKVDLKIPEGEASIRLVEFAKSVGVSLIFDGEQLEGIRTNAVEGKMEPEQALSIMLKDTPLSYDVDQRSRAIAVVKTPEKELFAESEDRENRDPNESDEITKTDNTTMIQKKPFLRRLLSGLAGVAVAAATPTVNAQDDSFDEDEIYELSPFVVQTEEGWVATDSLAGSRLKTDLKDVASQIEVMTLDFMDDFGVNSVEEALIYSLNVSGPEDVVTGNGNGFGVTQISNFNNVRGVGSATLSRNFFETLVPSDNYNITRLTIAAGPQAVLFGSGSPAGVLDVTNKRAELGSNFGTIRLQFDDLGGERYVFDYNREVVEGKVAVRVAAVNERRKQEWEPNHDDSKRFYFTALARPFEGTTISVHYEDIEFDRNRAPRMLPFDGFTPWFNEGAQPFENTWGVGVNPHQGDIYARAPDSVTLLLGPNNAGGIAPLSFNDSAQIRRPHELPGVANQDQDADGWTISDNQPYFPTDKNVRGTLFQQNADAEIFHLSIEQKITDKLFLEFATNREEFETFSSNSGVDTTVRVDPNRYLPDGVTPNPNFGKFYSDGIPSLGEDYNKLRSWRLTASYEFDFAEKFQDNKLLKWFGLHRIGGLISEDELINRGQQGFRYRIGPKSEDLPDANFLYADNMTPVGNRDWLSNQTRQLRTRFYFDGNGDPSPFNDQIKFDGSPITLTQADGTPWTIDPFDTGYVNGNGDRLLTGNGAQGTNTLNESWMITYQGFFWDGRIAATYGYRDITAKSKNYVGSSRDRGVGLWPYWRDLEFSDEFNEPQSGIARSTGITFHPFRGFFDFGGIVNDFTVHYNKSDTFQPNIGRFDPYGNEYPGAEGEGEDIGFRIDLFDNKLSIEYNEYELTAGPSRAANVPFNRWRDPVWNIENRVRQVWSTVPIINEGSGGFRELGRANYWVMSDNTSEGKEIVIRANPIKGLNIRFTYQDRETAEANIGEPWFQWVDERLPVWTSLNVPEGGDTNPRDLDGDGQIGTWTWDTAWYQDNNGGSETIAQHYNDVTINGAFGAAIIQALDGKTNEFDRSESWNLNLNYTFQEGRLEGFRAGGALRWRGAPLLDYGSTVVAGNEIVDLNNPFFGEEELKLDLAFSYRGKTDLLFGERNYIVQVNIRNAMDTDGLVPVTTDVNGAPTRIARTEGRKIIFSFELDI